MKLKDIWGLIKATFSEYSEDKVARLAAALSYYTLFSLAPLMIVVIAIAGLFFGQQAAQNQIVGQISSLVGPKAADAIQGMIAGARNQNASIIATIVGIVTLLLGATGVFTQLQEALNTIWEVQEKPGRGIFAVVMDRLLSFTMVLGIGFLLLVSLVITAALSAINQFAAGLFPGSELLWQIINFLISFWVIALLFALIFKILPDAEIAWHDVWLGAIVTAFLFTLGKWLIGLYLGRASLSSTYGAAASLVVILLWVYYSAQILFIGAEFTQVYANRFGSRVVPEKDAVRISEAQRIQQGMPHKGTVATAGGPAMYRAAPDVGAQKWETQTTPREPELLPEAQPSVLAISAVLAILVGFISGLVVKRENK